MVYERRISLDPRLSAIAGMLGSCVCCADIGSDHGRLGAFLLQNHRCSRVCLTDVSAPSLEKARRLIALTGLGEKAAFYVGDGAQALAEPVDAAVIAGMGGETIAGILERADGRLDGARLILQPNVAAPQLRRRMNSCGWKIEREALVKDGRRIYLILSAVQGAQSLDERECAVGPVLLRERPPLLGEYARFRLRVAGKALEGAARGGDEESADALRREIEIWEEVEACL